MPTVSVLAVPAANLPAPDPTADSAAAWLECGHRLAAGDTPADLLAALECYDRARAACVAEPDTPAGSLRELGLAWMNRANLLAQLGRPGDLESALNAYDAALAAFASIAAEPGVVVHLGAVWLNRGHVHLQRGENAVAVRNFRQAVELLRLPADAGDLAAARNAAGAALNLARILATSPSQEATDDAAIIALIDEARAWLAPFATTDRIAATLMLEAARVDLIVQERTLTLDSLGDFTDTVEAALSLAIAWRPRRHPTANQLAATLFELGAAAYAQCQPQFLLEFLRDHLDPATGPAPFSRTPAFHVIAATAIERLRADLARPRVLNVDDDAAHQLAALQRELDAPHRWLQTNPTSVSRP